MTKKELQEVLDRYIQALASAEEAKRCLEEDVDDWRKRYDAVHSEYGDAVRQYDLEISRIKAQHREDILKEREKAAKVKEELIEKAAEVVDQAIVISNMAKIIHK